MAISFPHRWLQLLQNVVQSATRMNRLVEDLLNYGRLGRIEMEPKPVSVAGGSEGGM